MITCICGKTGEGKSLYATWLIDQLVKQGRTVATNLDLKPAHPAYDKVVQIGTDDFPIIAEDKAFFTYMPPGCVYVIDEADVYFDASDFGKMLPQVKMYFKQHRKRKDDIILIVQFPANLYVRIRRLVQEWVWCHKDGSLDSGQYGLAWWFIPQKMWRFRRSSFATPEMKPAHFLRSGFFTLHEAERIYGWYKTEQLIGDTSFTLT